MPPMDFRDDTFAAEARSTSVPREVARAHPLDAPRVAADLEAIVAEKAFVDPLGALSSQARDGDDDPRTRDEEATTSESASDDDAPEPTEGTTRRRDDDEDREACAEWEATKRRFVARAGRVAAADARRRICSAAGTVRDRLEALGDPDALRTAESARSDREDLVETVSALRAQIRTAWGENDRLDALRLTIRAASLLDAVYPACAVAAADACAFYPALFALVCDVLDDAGAAIYARIKTKSERDDETGARRPALPRRFDCRDVPEDAKATCLTWFAKIERVPEVVPRVYLRIATLRCSRFVEDREALAARFATIVDVELKKIEDPLVGAFARAYAAKAGATLTRLRPRGTRAIDTDGRARPCFLAETLRSVLTDFADVVDLFDYPEYAAWKRRDCTARDAERAREDEDLIDAIEHFFVDAFDDARLAFDDGEEGNGGVDALRSGTGTASIGDEGADPASGALAALRDEKRNESVAEAMAWSARCFARRASRPALVEAAADFLATASARADGTAGAKRRPIKCALNVASARACLEAMSSEDAAAAAGTFVNLLMRAAGQRRNDAEGDGGDASVDPAILECVRILGARLSETPPPEVETRGGVLVDAWSIVATAGGAYGAELSSFLRCAETWTDFAVAHAPRENARGEEIPTVTSMLRDVAAKVSASSRQLGPSDGGAAPPTLEEDDQAAVERVLTRATRAASDRGDFALFESAPFGALVATLRGVARASFARNALRTLLRDCHSFETSARAGIGETRRVFQHEAARAALETAARAALGARDSLVSSGDDGNLVVRRGRARPNETDRLLATYVLATASFLRDRSALREASRFLARARVEFADCDAAQQAAALSAAWLGAAEGASERFAAETAAFCEVTAMGVRDDDARVRLYLSAACAASLRGGDAATRRRSRLVRAAVADLARRAGDGARGSASDASAAETAAQCAAALATLDAAPDAATSGDVRRAGRRETGRASSRRSLEILARFVLERRWKEGSADRVAACLAVARAAAALARREAVTSARAFSRRRVALLETAHACVQTAVDVSETVDATRAASDARAAAILDVAECVASSFAATAAMRDLAVALTRRAREDAVDARDGRVAAVEKTVARFCAAASEAGETLGV